MKNLNLQTLDSFAARETKRITLKQLTVFGRNLTPEKLIKSANYVREELPVRLAHRIKDFQQLPFIVGTNPHIHLVYSLYWDAFESFRAVPPITTLEENATFCDLLELMLNKHLVAIPQLAMGITECVGLMDSQLADKFMNDMLRSRIGRRVLAEQHLTLSKATSSNHFSEGWIGVVNTRCQADQIISKCTQLVTRWFTESQNQNAQDKEKLPKIKFDGDVSATFNYIPDHIEYIMFEILKNSTYFTLQHHKHQTQIPDIRVTVGASDSELTFRVSDQGGGIAKETISSLWSYSSISSNFKQLPRMAAKADEQIPRNLHLGLGLLMSKVYATYWGGSLFLHSMNGFGTDAYVKISVGNQQENL